MEYKLADLFDLQMGKTPSRNDIKCWDKGVYNWISIADLSNCGQYIHETKEKISDYAVKVSGIKVIPANTVVMSFKLSIGKVAITSKPIYSNEAIMAFIDRGKIYINPEYLYYLLMHKNWEDGSNKAVMGKTLNKSKLSQVTINVDSSEYQNEIVRKLNLVNKIIMDRKNQLKILDELVKSRFVEMFGDPVFNPKEWPIYELSKYIQFLTSGSRGWSQYFTDNGEYFITIKNVKNCQVILNDVQYVVPPHNAEAKRTRVQEGDLLISITADLGRTGVVTREIADHGGYINQHLTCVRLDRSAVRPLYVAFYMESEAGKRQFQTKNQSAVKAGLNFHSIKTLQIMVPPIELQDSFIVFVKEIHKSRLAIQKSLDETQLLFDSLMQKYFG
ncbi:hypothetical protein CJ260_01640 [Megasphaera sp. ASD88]|uniref:restriction endonuclease subunit S n=1 Tax=Megasphaera sp. ASD88 TaxID=2027407 RepID=UPI000BAB9981|nr:restriction endonuclease subunit S [Megasphaera sp. ASD88]PAV40165.1 hypothetical protein CJ260_01640 [Megasphaera sp. ASD88]